MKRLLKGLIILQINKQYYINPSFLQYGAFIETDIFIEMIKKDPKILKHIDRRQARKISYFR